jgi:uncharacterized protein YukE
MARSPAGAERIEGWLSWAGEAYQIVKPIVEFLANPLDVVTGDPEALRAKAEAWRTAATEVGRLGELEAQARTAVLRAWEGPAAEAFNAELAGVAECLRQVVEHFNGTAELLDSAADGAEQAEDLVVQIVKELIAWLIITIIVALASSWITLGASVAVGAAAGAAEAAVAAGRAAVVAARLARLLRAAQAFLKRMSDFAKAYKLTNIRSVGARNWAAQRYATKEGYQLLATNWVIKKTIVEPTAGVPIRKATGADDTVNWPAVL